MAAFRLFSSISKGVLQHSQVRLIGLDGKNLGIVAGSEALKAARALGASLIEAKATADPPVWRMTLPESKAVAPKPVATPSPAADSKGASMKEMRLTLGVAEHDLLTKVRQMGKFLEKGQRVRVTLRPSARATEKSDADTLLARIRTELQDLAPTQKIVRKDGSGKAIEVDFVPAASGQQPKPSAGPVDTPRDSGLQ